MVHFVNAKNSRYVIFRAYGKHLGHFAILFARVMAAVHDDDDHVHAMKPRSGRIDHRLVELGAWGVDPGRIDEGDLVLVGRRYPNNPSSRGLRLVADYRHLLTHDLVHQGALADVRLSHQSHESGSEHLYSRFRNVTLTGKSSSESVRPGIVT